MNSPTNAPEREPDQHGVAQTTKTLVGGLDYKTAALLCYVPILFINLISSIVFIRSEPKANRFLRFHAMQSLMLFGAYVAIVIAVSIISMILGAIPFLGMLAGLLNIVTLVAFVVFLWKSISGMIDASKGNTTKIEFIGELAEQQI